MKFLRFLRFWDRGEPALAAPEEPLILPEPDPNAELIVDDIIMTPPEPIALPSEMPEEPPPEQTPLTELRPEDHVIHPYADSDEHLWDELRRIDLLVRAHTRRWLQTSVEHADSHASEVAQISRTEIDAWLATDFSPPGTMPVEKVNVSADERERASALASAIDRRRAMTDKGVVLRFDWLARIAGIARPGDDLLRDILLVALLPEVVPSYRRLFGFLQEDTNRTQPTVELALEILDPTRSQVTSGRDAFNAASPLISRRLLVLSSQHHADEALPLRSIRLDDRIAAYLLGSNLPDARLDGIVTVTRPNAAWEAVVTSHDNRERLQMLAQWWAQQQPTSGARSTPVCPLVLLHGPHGAGQDAAARVIATEAQRPLVIVDTPAIKRKDGQSSEVIAVAFREAMLQGADIYWSQSDTLIDREASAHAWETLIDAASRFGGLTMLESRTAWEPDARTPALSFRRIDFTLPDFETRRMIWSRHLTTTLLDTSTGRRDALAAELANGFQLTEGQIRAAVETATGLAALRDPRECRVSRNDLFEGCRRQSGRHLMTFARRIETPPELTDDHLSLPPASKRQITELRQRIELLHRVHSGLGFDRRLSLGKGLIALFTGGPGTGKTMAAGLLARDCERDLYKVDLSAIVSKWVGETEKNLERVFAEAADTSAILFFDEADSIFGKRGEVKDAQDRWANMEVNYLLQRIEEYSGVVILASNFRQNIDESFLRRIHVLVDFPFPDADARFEILSSLFPPDVNRPDVDELRQVAQTFKLSGGHFKNIVLDAAFRSEAAGSQINGRSTITLRHLVDATAREYQKLGKPITKGEFPDPFYCWVRQDVLVVEP